MADEKKKKKEDDKDDELTPEEKLFRAIVRDDPEGDVLIDEKNVEDAGDVDDTDLEKEEIGGGILEWWKEISQTLTRLFTNRLKALKKLLPAASGGTTGERPTTTTTEPERAPWLQFLYRVAGLRTVNKVMLAIVIALVMYLLLDMVVGFSRPGSQVVESAAMGASQDILLFPRFPEDAVKPVSHYLPSAKKNAFFPPEPEAPAPDAPLTELPPESPPPVNYKLVGISWDAEEYIAMIQKEGTDHAVFIKKGEPLEGGIEVEDITEYSVKFKQDGKVWELK